MLGYTREQFPSRKRPPARFAAAVAGKNETQLTALLGIDWRQFCRRKVNVRAVARNFNKRLARRPSHCKKRQYGAPECRTRRLAAPVPMVKRRLAAGAFDMAAAAGNGSLTRTIGRMNFLPYRPCLLTLMRSRIITHKTIAGRTG
ncbi:DUF2950 family protein [Salmonella enterica subsp. enterica]|nr:DUF2950 family protein [Salmonella enterica subsp. enterica]